MDPYQQYPSPAGMYSGQRPTSGAMARQHFSSSTGSLTNKSNSMYRDPASAQKAAKPQQGAVAPPPPLIQPRADSTNRSGPRSDSETSRDATKNAASYNTPNSARGVSGQQQRMNQMGAYAQQKAGQYSARNMGYQNSPQHGHMRHPHARMSGGFSHSTNSLATGKAEDNAQRATGSRQGSGGQTGNTQYRRQQQKKDPAPEDETGHYQVVKGQTIDRSAPFTNGRYTIVKLLGTGTYGKVVQCQDQKYNGAGVAIKLVRREPPLYRVSAKNEIAILRDLGGKHGTLKLLRDFEHLGHVCMTFELLGDHLSDVLQKMGRPFKLEHVRDITLQLLHAVSYVHSKGIIHTDIKAENILLVGGGATGITIKVVDFGSALYSHAWHPPLVGTMHYRGPEAVLQAGWSFPLDVWALGCLCVELYSGQHLFELAHDDVHLYMMERLLGPIPADMLRKGYSNLNQYNRSLLQTDSRGGVRIAPCRMEGFQMVANMRRLKDIIREPNFLNLVRHMLEYDPNKRISASKAIEHPFFEVVDDGSTPDVEPAAPAPAQSDTPAANVKAVAEFEAQQQAARALEQARAQEQQQLKDAQALAKARSKSVADLGHRNSFKAAQANAQANAAQAQAPPPPQAEASSTLMAPANNVTMEPSITAAPTMDLKVPSPNRHQAPALRQAAPAQPRVPKAAEDVADEEEGNWEPNVGGQQAQAQAQLQAQAQQQSRVSQASDTTTSARTTQGRMHHRSVSMGGADVLSQMLQQRMSVESLEADAEEHGVMSDYADGVMSDYPLVSAPSRVEQAEAAKQDLTSLDNYSKPSAVRASIKPGEYKRPLADSDRPPPVPGQHNGTSHTESEHSQSSTAPGQSTWSGRVSHDSDYGEGSSEPGEGGGSGSMTPKETLNLAGMGMGMGMGVSAGVGWPMATSDLPRPGVAQAAPPLVQGPERVASGGGGGGWPGAKVAPAMVPPTTAHFLGELGAGARAE